MSFASCSVFLPMAHLLQPGWCSQDAAGSKLLFNSISFGMFAGRAHMSIPSFAPSWNEKTSWKTGKSLAGQETFPVLMLGRSSLSGAAPFPLVQNQICSPCSPGSGWSAVLSERLEVIFLGSWLMFPHLVSHNVVMLRNRNCSAEWASGGVCGSEKCWKEADF